MLSFSYRDYKGIFNKYIEIYAKKITAFNRNKLLYIENKKDVCTWCFIKPGFLFNSYILTDRKKFVLIVVGTGLIVKLWAAFP